MRAVHAALALAGLLFGPALACVWQAARASPIALYVLGTDMQSAEERQHPTLDPGMPAFLTVAGPRSTALEWHPWSVALSANGRPVGVFLLGSFQRRADSRPLGAVAYALGTPLQFCAVESYEERPRAGWRRFRLGVLADGSRGYSEEADNALAER